MGVYTDQVLPRFTDVALGKALEPTRARVAAGLSGDVLEIGFGSGRNLTHLPPTVERVLAVEPSDVARRLAARRIVASPFPIEFVGTDAQDLSLGDRSCDHVLVTWTLCTIPCVEWALQEARRVLRPGGTFHFVEHGRCPDPRTAQWQDRLTPIWRRLMGGCHLNRPIDQLIKNAGFMLESPQTYNMGGSDLVGYAYEGVAVKSIDEPADP